MAPLFMWSLTGGGEALPLGTFGRCLGVFPRDWRNFPAFSEHREESGASRKELAFEVERARPQESTCFSQALGSPLVSLWPPRKV